MPKKAKNHMREYTPAEIKLIRQLARQRVSSRVIAQRVGRSPGALRFKAMVEGIRFRSINRKPRRR